MRFRKRTISEYEFSFVGFVWVPSIAEYNETFLAIKTVTQVEKPRYITFDL